ncbi:MAG: NTPase [Candidatus Bathyarchaeia archaeon]
MHKRVLLLTGSPGVGKTTVLLKVVEALGKEGYKVGGMVSREVRLKGVRVGFEIIDLMAGRRGWLAHENLKGGPRVGKYGVNIEDLESLGVEALMKAVRECDVVAIDEVGPMELFSERFKHAVRLAVESGKLVVGVIHWKARDRLIEQVKARSDTEIFNVTYENRGKLHQAILEKAEEFLAGKRKH